MTETERAVLEAVSAVDREVAATHDGDWYNRAVNALIAAVVADTKAKCEAAVLATPTEDGAGGDAFSRGILTAVEAIRAV